MISNNDSNDAIIVSYYSSVTVVVTYTFVDGDVDGHNDQSMMTTGTQGRVHTQYDFKSI